MFKTQEGRRCRPGTNRMDGKSALRGSYKSDDVVAWAYPGLAANTGFKFIYFFYFFSFYLVEHAN
jgi:hypothetical protein